MSRRGLSVLLLAGLFALQAGVPACGAEEAIIALHRGVNLISLPLEPAQPINARDLAELTGATAVGRVRTGSAGGFRFETFLEGLGRAPFPLKAGEAYVILTSRERTLVLTGTPWPSEEPQRSLAAGALGIALTGDPGRLDVAGLTDRTGARFAARAVRGPSGRGELDLFVPGSSPSFPLLQGQGYLMRLDVPGEIELFEAPSDRTPPQLRILTPLDGQRAVAGTTVTIEIAASDESGLDEIELVHAGQISSLRQPPFRAAFTLTGTAGDNAVFEAAAFDRARNVTTRAVSILVLDAVRTTTVRGVVQETLSRQPVEGVRVSLAGTAAATRTAADGRFLFEQVPAGDRSLIFQGAEGVGGPYADYSLDLEVVEGLDNRIDRPIFLPRIDIVTAARVSTTQEATVISAPAVAAPDLPGIKLNVPAGAALTASGEPFEGDLTLTEVPAEFTPSNLPEGIRPGLVSTLQPAGIAFNRPLSISYPNVDRLGAGTKVDIYQLNHATGRFEVVGTGTVSADARSIVSDGPVLTSASWHAPVPRRPPQGRLSATQQHSCEEQKLSLGGGTFQPSDGSFEETIELPAFRRGDGLVVLRLVYDSARARGRVDVDVTLDYTGVQKPPLLNVNLSAPDLGDDQMSTYSAVPDGVSHYGFVLEGASVPTGSYPLRAAIEGDYRRELPDGRLPGSVISSFIDGRVDIVNDADSPFGAGWTLEGIDVVFFEGFSSGGAPAKSPGRRAIAAAPASSCGTVLLKRGAGGISRFDPAVRATASIDRPGERDFYRFPASLGDRVTLSLERTGDSSGGASTLDPSLELFNSRGILVARDRNSGLNEPPGPGSNARIASFRIPATDVYTTVVRGDDATRGRYQLTLSGAARSRLVTDVPAAPLTILQPAFSFTGGIETTGAVETVTFTAPAGQSASVRMDRLDAATGSGGLDPVLELLGPANESLALDDDSGTAFPAGPGNNARIAAVTLPTTGTYTIRASGGDGTTGRYELEVFFGAVPGRLEVAGLGEVTLRDVVLRPDGEHDTVEFDALTCQVTVRTPGGVARRFDASGRLLSNVDINGQTTRYFHQSGQLSGIVFPRSDASEAAPDVSFHYAAGKLSHIRDPAGRETRFQIDGEGNLVEVAFPDDSRRRFDYDRRHGLTGITFEDGSREELTYDARGHLTAARSRSGGIFRLRAATSLTSQASGASSRASPAVPVSAGTARTTLADRRGHSTSYRTDALGALLESGDPLGRVEKFTRNRRGQVTRHERADATVRSSTYDALGNLTSMRDETTGSTWTLDYVPGLDRLRRLQDPLGNTTTLDHDAGGNPVRITDAMGNASTFVYDSSGRLVSASDPQGNVSRIEYGAAGLVSATVDPLGNRTEIVNDAAGLPVAITAPGGRTTRIAYTARGQVAAVTDPLGNRTSLLYDRRGRLRRVTLPASESLTTTYDTADRPTTRTDSLGNTVTIRYDSDGQPVSILDAESREQHFTYDAAGQLIETLLGDGSRQRLRYDSVGRIVAAIRGAGSPLEIEDRLEYNSLDRLVSVTRAFGTSGAVTLTAGHDANGDVVSLTNGRGKSWSFARDALRRVVTVTDPLGQVARRLHDAVGRVSSVFEFSGQEIRRSYDAASRPVRIEYLRAGGALEDTVVFEYDAAGNLKRLQDGDTDIVLTYDLADRLIALEQVHLGKTQRFEYNGSGRLTGSTVDAEPAALTERRYDAAGRLTEILSPLARIGYRYDRSGRLAGAEMPHGVTRELGYDQTGRLVSNVHSKGGFELQSEGLAYDALGRVVEKRQGDAVTAYRYDERDQIVRADYPNGFFETFAFDAAGNRTGLTTPGGMTMYEVDDADRLLRVTEPGAAGPTRIGHDADGQLESILPAGATTPTRYLWNVAGQLVTVRTPEGREEAYRYHSPVGPLTNLRWETAASGLTPERQLWGPDGNPLLDLGADGTATRRFVTGESLDEVPVEVTPPTSGVAVLLGDHLQSVVGRIDGPEATLLVQDYRAFGARAPPEVSDKRLGYTGRGGSELSGLLYLRNRWYSPELGRFINQDPIGFLGGLNLYSYVGNNPVTYRDPMGLIDPVAAANAAVDLGTLAINVHQGNAGAATFSFFSFLVNSSAAVLGPPGSGFALQAVGIGGRTIAAVHTVRGLTTLGEAATIANRLNTSAATLFNVASSGGGGRRPSTSGGTSCPSPGTRSSGRPFPKPRASNQRLRDTIDALFQPGDSIHGGTAGAIRNELRTGQPTGGLFHSDKGLNTINRLRRILVNEPLTPQDRLTAERILYDLQRALGGQ